MAAATSSSRQPKEHRCNLCGRVFASSQQLETHKKMDHGTTSSPPAGVG
ncbi:MAG TPA: C2H2-type zinc finger protein [Nitrososphaera sp.]|nr:C2H2-type zinc finger protein [Nitrososphaera sp.]